MPEGKIITLPNSEEIRAANTSLVAGQLPLVGRRHEKDQLLSAIGGAIRSEGAFMLLAGDPGVGKTRLSEEIAREAGRLGFSVVWGRCWEGGGAPPYWPWTQVLRSCANGRDPRSLNILAGADAAYLAGLAPEIFTVFSRGVSTAELASTKPVAGSGGGEAARFQLFDSVTAFLRRTAAVKPLLLVLDDLHAADQESILLLDFFARSIRETRIAVIATYRELEVRLSHRLTEMLGDMGRHAQTIVIHGLSKADVRDLVQMGTGVAAEEGITEELFRATEGNPFFVTEILRLLMAEDSTVRSDMAHLKTFNIPASVRAAIRRRLKLIPKGAREILGAACIIGREFDYALVQSVYGGEGKKLSGGLDDAASSGLVIEIPSVPGRYRFRHALINETLYGDLPPKRRQQLHLSVAQALEQLRVAGSDENLTELAHHYASALPISDLLMTVSYISRAAQRAMTTLAYEEAARLYGKAFGLVEFSRLADDAQRCELLLALGEAQCRARDYDHFKQTFERAASIARTLGDPPRFGRAVLGFAMLGSNPGTADQATISLLKEALVLLGGSEDALRANLLARLADEMLWLPSHEQTTATINEAIDIARKSRNPAVLLEALYINYHSMRGPSRVEERLSLATEIVDMAERHGLRDWLLRVRYHRAAVLLELGDLAKADSEVEAIGQIPEPLRLQHLGFTELMNATRAQIRGRLSEAESLALEALRIGTRRPNSTAEQIFTFQTAAIRRDQGRLGEIQSQLELCVARHPENTTAYSMLALTYCETGRAEQGRALLERVIPNEFACIKHDYMWLSSVALLAETCACVSDAEGAGVLQRLLAPYAQRHASVGFLAYHWPVSYFLGRLSATMNCWGDAAQHLTVALGLSNRIGAHVAAAWIEYHLAAALFAQSPNESRMMVRHLLLESLGAARAFNIDRLAENANSLLGLLHSGVGEVSRSAAPGVIQGQAGRVLATILFMDIVGSTSVAAAMGDRRWVELLDQYLQLAHVEISRFGGREMGNAGDGFLAIFDKPTPAICCAVAIRKGAQKLSLEVRAGLHTGECELAADDVRGLAVHIGARVMSEAGSGEVLVSRTVRDMVVGSELTFAERGVYHLKGVPGEWQLFLAQVATNLP